MLSVDSIVEATDLLGMQPRRVVAVLVGYFDDSGTHDGAKTAVMAGYVAHRADWKRFEQKTKRLFDEQNIEFFRAKMFHHGEKQFSGWSEDRKLGFASKWFDTANRYVLRGVTAGMKKADFTDVKRRHRKLSSISFEAYCMQMGVKHICGDAQVWAEIEKYGLHIVIESSGTVDVGIRLDLERAIAANDIGSHIRAVTFAKKRDVRALQLGDYLAYYSQRFAETAISDSLDGITPYLDIAKNSVPTIMKLAEKFEPNPDFRALVSARKRASSTKPS